MIRPFSAFVLATSLLSALPGCRWLRACDPCPGPADNPPPAFEDPKKDNPLGVTKLPDPMDLPGPLSLDGKKTTSVLQPPPEDDPSHEAHDRAQANAPPPPDAPPPDGPRPDLPRSDGPPAIQPVVAEKPAPPRSEPLLDALRCMLDNHPDEALQHLKHYDAATQELFIRLLPPMALLSHKTLDKLSPPEVAALHEQLQGLITALRPRTELTIGKMCFCEWIKSYGVYKPVAADHVFQAGTSGQPGELVQLYVELQNFCSERREPYHETRLSSVVELFDKSGKPAWYYRFDDRKQPFRSLSPLHDFFNNYSFHLPRDVPPGTYTLTITVVDETLPDQPRSAKKSLSMTVRAP